MEKLVAAGAAGVQVRVHDADGDWTGSAGVAELGRPDPVPAGGRFRIGSVTKPFAAAVVLMLCGQGELALDDPVRRYLPQWGLEDAVTVRTVLMHISGLANYSGDNRPDGSSEPGVFPAPGPEYVQRLETSYPPEELIRFGLTRERRCVPGAGFAYSNTNYLLVQLIIEKITGTSYADQIRHRITRPLGMRDTLVPVERTDIPGPHAHGYLAYRQAGELTVVDVTRSSPTWYGAAGSVISTTADLDLFLYALVSGQVLDPPRLAEMLTFVPPPPGPGVSAGLFRKDFQDGRTAVGHFGNVPGFMCFLYGTTDGAARMVLSATRGAVDRSDPVAVKAFLAATDEAVTDCFSALRVPHAG